VGPVQPLRKLNFEISGTGGEVQRATYAFSGRRREFSRELWVLLRTDEEGGPLMKSE
jgi:hypothetical protein